MWILWGVENCHLPLTKPVAVNTAQPVLAVDLSACVRWFTTGSPTGSPYRSNAGIYITHKSISGFFRLATRCPASVFSSVDSYAPNVTLHSACRVAKRAPVFCPSFLFTTMVNSGRYRSPTAFAVQQVPALSSTCGQRHVESRRRRLKRLV